jgi:hypothetical protein
VSETGIESDFGDEVRRRIERVIGSGVVAGGESGIVFPPISEITAPLEKSFYPFAIADTFRITAMKFDGG